MYRRWTVEEYNLYQFVDAPTALRLQFHEHDPLNDGYELTADEADELARELAMAAETLRAKEAQES